MKRRKEKDVSNFFQNDTDSLIKSLMDFIRESASGAPRGIRTPDLRIRSQSPSVCLHPLKTVSNRKY